MVQAVIFDVDGTLVDSVDAHAASWQQAFSAFGHDLAYDAIRGQIGKGGDQLMPVFLKEAELEAQSAALESRRSAILRDRYLPGIKPFPKVRALFERLRQDKTRIVLASSAKAAELGIYKQMAGIADLVDEETTSDDTAHSKPQPDIFEAALARLNGIEPTQVIVVGDTPYDAQAAAKAGLRTVGVLCGGFSAAQLQEAGCIAIYDGPGDLLERYAQSPLAPGVRPSRP